MRQKELARTPLFRGVMLGVCVGLAACGGGGGGGNVRSDPPPAPTAPTPPTTPPPTTPPPTTPPPTEPPPTTPPPVEPPPTPPPPPPPAIDAHLAITGARNVGGLTGREVVIGFLDTGISNQHPALGYRARSQFTHLDPVLNDLSLRDKVGHGTQVAQIAAGIAFGDWPGGVAPGAWIESARFLKDVPDVDGRQKITATDPSIVEPVDALIDRGARIINVSTDDLYWDQATVNQRLFQAFGQLANDHGVLTVVAAGDGGNAQPSQFARMPEQAALQGVPVDMRAIERGWLTVGAVSSHSPNQLAPYSNACGITRNYCMVAPGDVIVSGANDVAGSQTKEIKRSTDFAAPQVSGAAALVLQAFPYLTGEQVKQVLLGTATDLGAPGVDDVFGWGRLDAAKAVKGPRNLAWGDMHLRLENGLNGGWAGTLGNDISGEGGLTIDGGGRSALMYMTGHNTYKGPTRLWGDISLVVFDHLQSDVQLESRSHLTLGDGASLGSNVRIAHDGSLHLGSYPEMGNMTKAPIRIAGSIDNQGAVWASKAAPVTIDGNYVQDGSATFNTYLGAPPLHVEGTATLAGMLEVTGELPGYVANSRTLVMTADGGVVDRFWGWGNAMALTYNMTLYQDANNVWLDVSRVNVAATAAAAGFTAQAMGSAERVEGAFQEIDKSLAGEGEVEAGLLAAAGELQHASGGAGFEGALASLSGELHDADSAFAMMAIEGNRHALESRLDAAQAYASDGAWAERIDRRRGWSSFDVDASGWMMGLDRRYAGGLRLGLALSETDGNAWHGQRADRERNRQVEGQLYAQWPLGEGGYLLGSGAFGHMQRWIRREVDLGATDYRIASDYAQRYTTASLQAGRRFGVAGTSITPYAGALAMRLYRDGFREDGAAGFGLTSAGASYDAAQAMAGVRFGRDWSTASARWTLQGRMEWQHLMVQPGQAISARFTGMDVWSPIVGAEADRDVGVFGLGLGTLFGRGHRVSFDLDSRSGDGRWWTGAMATWTSSF